MNNISSVRRIPRKNRSLSGEVSIPRLGISVPYESGLERDFVFINAIDPDVTDIVSQPCQIAFKDEDSKDRYYTPDYLVIYKSPEQSPLLIEIKYSQELTEKADELKQKFTAAKSYAAGRKWCFTTSSEKEIRTAYLDNAKRLLPLQTRIPDPSLSARLLDKALKKTTIKKLLDRAALDGVERARGFNTILTLIAQTTLTTN